MLDDAVRDRLMREANALGARVAARESAFNDNFERLNAALAAQHRRRRLQEALMLLGAVCLGALVATSLALALVGLVAVAGA